MKSRVTGKPADFATHIYNPSTIKHLGTDTFLYRGIPRGKPCPCGSGKKFKHCCSYKAGPFGTPDEGKENNDG